ncbi:MAG TPA: VWA domain-containing protein, partial [Candidatus Limnocylindria bacterium]|nr:VWA domain-containing protein [Candidatus Limnocylindria bacterium]
MSFANPQLVTLMLLVVPATAGFFFWAWKQKQLAISKFVRSRLREQLTLGVSHHRQWVKSGLILAGLACVFVALARPRWGVGEEIAKAEGVDIVVCVDVSRSMQATDVSPSRLARAKLACYDLLHATGTDRLGLVAFAGGAFLQCPLTLDDDAFRQNVAALDTDSIPEQGTALGQAIDEAKAAFGQDAASQKAIIIVTDGEDHEPGAVTAAKDCASAGIRIFTIGVGSVAGELLKSTDPYGNSVFFKDEDGSPVKSRLNEELLRQIAESAGGFYLHLDNSDTMGELYRRAFANVAKTKFSTTTFRHWIERFQWPLGLGILLLAIEILIPDHGKIRSKHSGRHLEVSKPLPTTPPVPAVAAATTVALMLLLIGLPRAQASTGKAETQYQKGQFEGALAEYEKLAKENPDDPRLRFNAGASAYRSGDYKKAGGLFEQVLTAQDLKLQQQAWYNLGNTHFKLGEEA